MSQRQIRQSLLKRHRTNERLLRLPRARVTALLAADKTILALCLTPNAVEREITRLHAEKHPDADQIECATYEVLS
jgi:hypothetical protein